MRSYTLLAPAKINLYLEILGDHPDGYHELVMILQSIELADQIEVRANGIDKIRLFCHHPDVPLDESNLAYRAAKLMAKNFPKVKGINKSSFFAENILNCSLKQTLGTD